MDDDTLARARRVVEGLRAAEEAWLDLVNAYPENGMSNDADDLTDRICDARERFVDRLMPDAAPALIALAAAVGRLVDERRKRGSDPWYLQFGWNDDAYMPCIGCELMNLDARTGDHAPDCPALAIDAALAQLAALADDES